MAKEIKCPHCGGARYEQIDNGICKCLYCRNMFVCDELRGRIESNPEKPKQHTLTISWEGMSVIVKLYDIKVPLNVNGINYGDAYFFQGFSIDVPVEKEMTITLYSRTFSFSLDPGFDYVMQLKYSRINKWFTSYTLLKKEDGHVHLCGEQPINKGISVYAYVYIVLILLILFFMCILNSYF